MRASHAMVPSPMAWALQVGVFIQSSSGPLVKSLNPVEPRSIINLGHMMWLVWRNVVLTGVIVVA